MAGGLSYLAGILIPVKSWVNLHQHTAYSMLDGLNQPTKLVEQAARIGLPALSITDHGNVHGWLDFYEACVAGGIKPILGIEGYQARKTRFDRDEEERAGGKAADELGKNSGPYHLTILARNLTGYRNLMKLSSRAFLEGFYVKPRMDHELIAQHSEGLIILSGCLNGEVQQALLRNDRQYALHAAARWQEIVGKENFYIEIQDHGLSEQRQVKQDVIEIAKKLGAPIVATGDCHYAVKEDAHAHDVMLCVSTGATLDQENRFKFFGPEFYLKSYQEMSERFPDEWLRNTLAVADSVELELSFGDLHFPDFDLPPGETSDSFLERQVYSGLRVRYGEPLPQDVLDRTEYELRVVKQMGFQSYFLVVSDLVGWAREQGIRVGWGRGSAAGSILSYALHITNLDPLRFGLLFERFLVEGRKSMPDIDLDIDDRYRSRVIDYARSKYGSDRVANICNFYKEGARAAIRDAARVLGYDYALGDRTSKMVPPPILGISKSIDECLTPSSEMLKAYESDKEVRHIIDTAKGLEGLIRQTGVHAAGVLIAPGPLLDYVPLMQKGEGEPIITQWEMNASEKTGLLKVDFLALRNLGVIDMTVDNIGHEMTEAFAEAHPPVNAMGKTLKTAELDIDEIPLDDAYTYQQLCAGHSQGVFQLESAGMREKMIAMQPSSIEDIMALISLYRPGPLGSGMDRLYISRKHGRSAIEYAHPKLKDILESSYGIMLYQEDVLAVARHLAGMSAGDADDLRKAIGKKEMKTIGKFRQMFVKGCKETSNVDAGLANKIYSDIEYFGGYGFNRAHAASYAMVSYVTAYLKFNHPAEYMAALLTSVDSTKKAAPYLNECRRMGITVKPPSINESVHDFRVVSPTEILFGLGSIDGMGASLVGSLLAAREQSVYTSVFDFMRRTDIAVLNKSALEHLLRAGAFDELVPDQPERLLTRAEKLQLLDLEKDELGLYISDHPLLGIWPQLEPIIDCTIVELDSRTVGEQVTVGGLISKVNKKTTKRGDKMMTLILEDLTGSVEILVFPRDYPKNQNAFSEGDIVMIDGRLQKDGDDEHPVSKLFFSGYKKPDIPEYSIGDPIVLRLNDRPTHGIIERINELIEDNPGDNPIYIEFPQGKHQVSLAFKKPSTMSIYDTLQMLALKDNS